MANRGFWALKGTIGLLGLIFVLAVVFAPSVLAVSGVKATPSEINLRSETDSSFDNSIIASNNDRVDISLRVFVDETTGASSTSNIPVQAYAQIDGLQSGGTWVSVGRTTTQDKILNLFESATFTFNDAFLVTGSYSQYRVSGYARTSNESSYNGPIIGTVSRVLQNGECSQVRINSFNVTMNENDQRDFSFTVFNDSDTTFRIDSVDFIEGQNYLTIDERTSDTTIAGNSSGSIRFRANSYSVDRDSDATVSLRVSGHFQNPSTTCSSSQIGEKNFTVRVNNTGSSNFSQCQNVRINATPVTAISNSSTDRVFSVFNNSSQRFFVRNTAVSDNADFFDFSSQTVDSSIAPFSIGTWRTRIQTQTVTTERAGNATLQMAGDFENNGINCSLNDISQSIGVTVLPQGRDPVCASILLDVYDGQLDEDQSKELLFRLQNPTSKSFRIDSVELTDDDSDLEVSLVSKDSSIGSGQTGNITVRIRSDFFDFDKTVNARIRIRGTFDNGNSCGLTDIQAPFRVRLLTDDLDNGDNDNDDDFGSAFCSELNLITDSIFVAGGTSNSASFELENNSNQTFFIEGVDAYDNSSRITVTTGTFDSFVRSDDRANISVQVRAQSTSDRFTETGFIRIAGRFSSGQTCSFTSGSTRSFSVLVNSSSTDSQGSNVCQDVSLTVPTTATISGTGTVSFSVNNPTSQTVWVFLRADNATVSPNTFAINAHENKSLSAAVQTTSAGGANVEFFIVGNDCQGTSKFTRVSTSTGSAGTGGNFVGPVLPTNNTNDVSIVFVPSETIFANQTTLVVSVKNNSNQFQTVSVSLSGFSSAWFLDKKTVSMAPNETKTVYLDIFSNNAFGPFNGSVVASTASGQTSRPIVLSAMQTRVVAPEIQLAASSKFVGNNAEITVMATDNSFQQAHGTLQLESEDGVVLDSASLTVNPSETKTTVFVLENSRGLDAGNRLTARFLLDDGREASTLLVVSAKPTSFGGGTGFASLNPSLFWGGIIFLVLLILIVGWWQSMQKKSWQRIHPTPITLISPVTQTPSGPAPMPAPEPAMAPHVMPSEVQSTTTQRTTTKTTSKSSDPDRFWFLQRGGN